MGITNSNKELNAARIDCSGKATAVAKRPRRLAKSRLSNPFLQKKQPTNRWAVSFGGEGGIRILGKQYQLLSSNAKMSCFQRFQVFRFIPINHLVSAFIIL